MDQNQTIDNDLQKAIDNITNNTNTDPVFSDPVAAPSSIPEGDTGELSEPIGPFPEAKVEMVPPAPEPLAPLESMDIPEFNNPTLTPPPAPEPPETPAPLAPAPETPIAPEPLNASVPSPAPEPTTEEPTPTIEKPALESIPQNLNTDQIKKAALRDLVPLLDKVSMDNAQKFNIYKDIFQDLKDYSVLEPAYNTAREIPDETSRAEALLYLVESIDKM